MADSALLADWESSVEQSTARTRRVKFFIFLMFTLPALLLLLLGNLVGLAAVLIETGVLVLVVRHLRRPTVGSRPEALPEGIPLLDALTEDVAAFAQRLGVPAEKAKPLLDRGDLCVSPSVRNVDSTTYVHIPVGFLKLYGARRIEARAILAHEVAHIGQNDWRLWATLSGFLTVLKWIILPLVALSLMTSAALMVDLQIDRNKILISQENLRDYSKLVDRLRETREDLSQLEAREDLSMGMAGSSMSKLLGLETLPDEAIEKAKEELFRAYFLPSVLLFVALWRFANVRLLARRRAESEYLADRAAAILTSPQAVAQAVTMLGNGRPRWALLSSHVRNEPRIAALEREFGMIDLPPAVQTPIPATRDTAIWLSVRARLTELTGRRSFHRLFGWGGPQPDRIRIAVMSIAVILTSPLAVFAIRLTDPSSISTDQLTPSTIFVPHETSALEPFVQVWQAIVGAFSVDLYDYPIMADGMAKAVSIALALWLFRRDDVAIATSAVCTMVLTHVIYATFLPDSPNDFSPSTLTLNFINNIVFFLAVAAGLGRQMSVGKALMTAVLADVAIGFVLNMLSPQMWDTEYGPFFASVLESRTRYNLLAATLLLAGDAAATKLRGRTIKFRQQSYET